jgi:hypothetical protein
MTRSRAPEFLIVALLTAWLAGFLWFTDKNKSTSSGPAVATANAYRLNLFMSKNCMRKDFSARYPGACNSVGVKNTLYGVRSALARDLQQGWVVESCDSYIDGSTRTGHDISVSAPVLSNYRNQKIRSMMAKYEKSLLSGGTNWVDDSIPMTEKECSGLLRDYQNSVYVAQRNDPERFKKSLPSQSPTCNWMENHFDEQFVSFHKRDPSYPRYSFSGFSESRLRIVPIAYRQNAPSLYKSGSGFAAVCSKGSVYINADTYSTACVMMNLILFRRSDGSYYFSVSKNGNVEVDGAVALNIPYDSASAGTCSSV